MRQIVFLLFTAAIFPGCKKNTGKLYEAEIICRGGCVPTGYYATIKNDTSVGRTHEVFDANGNSRGVLSNIVIINNLVTGDRVEGKKIYFQSFKEPAVSCQSSFPRAQLEIEIKY